MGFISLQEKKNFGLQQKIKIQLSLLPSRQIKIFTIRIQYLITIIIQYNIAMKTEKQISNYIFSQKKMLGTGSFGSVYQGFDSLNQMPVAVKKISEAEPKSGLEQELVRNQIKACQMLVHPNLMKTYTVQRAFGYCHIISELYEGGTIRELLKAKGNLTELQSLSLFEGIIEGYAKMIQEKILHRDLKTENIILNKAMEPVIIDFGCCQFKETNKTTKKKCRLGSDSYSSPEAFLEGQYSEKSDVWSLGIVLYQMLTGNTPKVLTKSFQIHMRKLSKLDRLNYDNKFQNLIVAELLQKCLTIDPNKRSDIAELKQLFLDWKVKNQASQLLRKARIDLQQWKQDYELEKQKAKQLKRIQSQKQIPRTTRLSEVKKPNQGITASSKFLNKKKTDPKQAYGFLQPNLYLKKTVSSKIHSNDTRFKSIKK